MSTRFKRDTSVRFGAYDTYADFKMLLIDEDLGFPELQTNKVTVPGRDGDVDLTAMIDSTPHFGNRVAKWKFALVHSENAFWYKTATRLLNQLHGKEFDIVSENEPDLTLHGRVTVKSFTKFTSPGTIEIEADCQPYRTMAGSESGDWEWDPFSFVDGETFYRNWSGSDAGVTYEGELKNLGSRPMPMIVTTTADVTFVIDGESWNLAAGGRHNALYISPGVTPFTYSFRDTGGTLSFSYGMEKL